MSIVINILLVIHVIISVLIIFFVLMQRPKSEGLGAAFGGGMTENLFGAQTTNVLSTITRWLAGIFFALTLMLSVLYAKQSTTKSTIQKQLLENAKPVPAANEEGKKQILEKMNETVPVAAASPEPSAASAPATPVAEKAPMPVAPAEPTATPAPAETPVSAATPAPVAPAAPKAAKPSLSVSKHKKP